MPEPLSFLTVFTATPAALKFGSDALDFWAKVKELRGSRPDRPLIDADTFTKVEKRQLEAMYAAIDIARPVAADIATRAFRFYLFVAGLLLAVLVAASAALAWIPARGWLVSSVIAVCVAGPLVIKHLPSPVPDIVPILNNAGISGRAREILESLGATWSDVRMTRNVAIRGAGVSIPERVFLNLYFRAAALIRILECDAMVADLEKGISTAHETLTGRVFNTGLTILRELADHGRLNNANVEDRKAVLSAAFSAAGIGDLVDAKLVGDDFFQSDFATLAKTDADLRKHLERYWSSRPRC